MLEQNLSLAREEEGYATATKEKNFQRSSRSPQGTSCFETA
jgi:hypothetical protein